jgi:hypothetical protein
LSDGALSGAMAVVRSIGRRDGDKHHPFALPRLRGLGFKICRHA